MKLILMSAIFAAASLAPVSPLRAEEEKIVTQPQIVVTTRGKNDNPLIRPNPQVAERPKNTKETSILTDASGAKYEVVRYTRYDSRGNMKIRTVVKGPDGREVELKSKIENID